MCAPLIGRIDIADYLHEGQIEQVLCGGENYEGSRPCHYEWVELLSRHCRKANVSFVFCGTGSRFVKDGKTYSILVAGSRSKPSAPACRSRASPCALTCATLWALPFRSRTAIARNSGIPVASPAGCTLSVTDVPAADAARQMNCNKR